MNADLAAISEVPEPEFFIVLVATGTIFAVGAVITFFAFLSLRRAKSSKLWQTIAFVPLGCGTVVVAPFVFLLLSWIAYWVLPQHVTTQTEVIRHYHGVLYGANEDLDLNENGTFKQTVIAPSGIMSNKEGTWKLEGNFVVLDDYLMFYDSEHNKLSLQPRPMSYVMYRYYYKDKFLVNDWDSGHYILKGQ